MAVKGKGSSLCDVQVVVGPDGQVRLTHEYNVPGILRACLGIPRTIGAMMTETYDELAAMQPQIRDQLKKLFAGSDGFALLMQSMIPSASAPLPSSTKHVRSRARSRRRSPSPSGVAEAPAVPVAAAAS